MEKNSNVFLWEGFKNAKKELNINGFKIRQLKIKEQIDILEKALKNGDESEVFYFILNTEPIDYKISNRELTIGLLDFLL